MNNPNRYVDSDGGIVTGTLPKLSGFWGYIEFIVDLVVGSIFGTAPTDYTGPVSPSVPNFPSPTNLQNLSSFSMPTNPLPSILPSVWLVKYIHAPSPGRTPSNTPNKTLSNEREAINTSLKASAPAQALGAPVKVHLGFSSPGSEYAD